jgi:mRNA interferase RelE/StbE
MPYRIEFDRGAVRGMRDLPQGDQRRVMDRIDGLADEPRPKGVEKMSGMRDAYRVRVGVYRIVYRIDDASDIVTITRVGHRREVYR